MPRRLVRRAGWIFGFALCLANLIVGAYTLQAARFAETLSPAAMTPDTGHNFIAIPTRRLSLPFVVPWDTGSSPEASDGRLFEDGKPLGPAHSQHADIRSLGKGRFSFWSGELYFSTSDNSDPLTNGRTYSVVYGARLTHAITYPLAVLDALAASIVARLLSRFAWFRRLFSSPMRYAGRTAALAVAVFAARLLAAAFGWMDPLFAGENVALGEPLVSSIVAHLLLGVGAAMLVAAMGAGVLVWAGGRRRALDDIALRAFLPGTLVAAIAAVVALALPHGSIVAGGICLAAAAPIAAYRPEAAAVKRLLLPPLLCGPFVLVFGAILSFTYHGPTATLAGTPVGDTTIYVGEAETLTQHLSPFFNYAAEGFRLAYANALPSLLASPLLRSRWFDPYLFFSATLPVLAMLTLATLLPALARVADRHGLPRRLAWPDVLVIGVLLFGMLRSPSMMIGSPPFVFLFPIVIASVHLSLVAASPWRSLAVASLGTAVSKVIGFVTLVPLSLFALAAKSGQRQRIAAGLCGLALLVYATFNLLTYLPFILREGNLGPTSLTYYLHYPPATLFPWFYLLLRDAGVVLLAVAVTRFSSIGLRVGVWISALGFVALPFLFYSALTAAMLTVATAYLVRPSTSSVVRWTMLAAAVLVSLQQTFGFERDNAAVTLSWAAMIASIVVSSVALGAGTSIPVRRSPGTETRPALPLVAAVFLVLLLWGSAVGTIHAGPDAHLFTPEMRDIWRAVRERTPSKALIFTDQTDDTPSRIGGWNDYALAARRQFYLVSWEVTPLRQDGALLRLWLERNAAVLAGTTEPSELSLSRRYDGFYAVVDAKKPAPLRASILYANASYVLYKLPDD